MRNCYRSFILMESEIVYKKLKDEEVFIKSSEHCSKYIRHISKRHINVYECMYAVYLSNNNKVVKWAKISQGGTARTVIDIKIILKHAIDCLSSSFIIIHNHPSGNKYPSEADKKITGKINNACKLIDMKLLDSIIITDDSYYSFADEGIL